MPTFNNLNQLEKYIKSQIKLAVQDTRDYIYEMINFYIIKYYGSYSPEQYQRTYQFADSLIKMDVSVNGSSISTEVKINEDFLSMNYNPTFTGQKVAEYANLGLHGLHVQTDVRFWQDALEELGGEAGIENLLKSNSHKYLD